MSSPASAAVAVLERSLRQFRLLEARGVSQVLATDYPVAQDYADMLDSYHYFLVGQRPSADFGQRARPFVLDPEAVAWVALEKNRLERLWTAGWEGRPGMNLFALSYWSAAQYDGLRAAVWLQELFQHLSDEGRTPETVKGLNAVVQAYCGGDIEPTGKPFSIYAALDVASAALEDLIGESPLDLVTAYRPAPLGDLSDPRSS